MRTLLILMAERGTVKTVILMHSHACTDTPSLPDLLVRQSWALQARRIVVQIGMPAPGEQGADPTPPVYDAIAEIWSDTPVADTIPADPVLAAGWTFDIRTSQEVVGKAESGPALTGVTPGLSQLSFIRAIDGMARTETARHWDEHIPLACAIHVGMNRYTQDRLSSGENGARPWFGMAHLHFPDADALRDGLFRSPEDMAVIGADVAEFVSDHATMLAIEHVVKA
jgi:uncharacterized protein (TIGR02118 family)